MVEPWAIQLLGGLAARQGDRTVSRFRTQKTGALLAYLALHAGRALPREILLETLWPESDLPAARNSLNVALSSLRSQLEPPAATPGASPLGTVLVADRSTVRLNPDGFTTDVAAFESALRRARTNPDHLAAAIALYTGELLPGFYEDWALGERNRLADAYQDALRQLATWLLDRGQPDVALDYAHRAVQADPLGEESRRLLMRAYAGLGQPAALREQLRELECLRDEAGEVAPSAETRWLALRLAEGAEPEKTEVMVREVTPAESPASSESSLPSASSTPAATTPSPDNLPLFLTRYFGQGKEIERLSALLSGAVEPPSPTGETRLVTLLGPGGSGKTRLAIEAARTVQAAFSAGVWFVPLADRTDPAVVPAAIREALRLPGRANVESLDQVADFLGERPALFILDNLEQLVGRGPLDPQGIAAQVRALLRRLPTVTLLATSRQPLGIAGEIEYPVPLLPVPSETALAPADLLQFASVQLFADRAQNRKPDFQVTPRNAEAVGGLVAQLDGMPLAIELAAAWSGLLSPAQMRDRLQQRLDLLVSCRLDIPERHRTLRGAIEWGYDLLSPDVRRLFTALSVFRGDFSAEAAEAVCEGEAGIVPDGRTLECLSRLRDASFLIAEEGEGEMRFRLLETLRAFADECLPPAERAHLEQRHADYFLLFVEEANRLAERGNQVRCYDRLEAELPNLRAALERFVETETGLRIAARLGYFWKMRGYYREGRAWLERALRAAAAEQVASGDPTDDAGARARALAWNAAGMLADDMGDYETAHQLFEWSSRQYRVLGDRKAEAVTTCNRGNIAYRQGDYATARALYTAGLDACRANDDIGGIASMLGSLGNVAQAEGNLPEARRLQEECLYLAREVGESRLVAYTLHNLGNLATLEHDPERARLLYRESLVGKRALGDRRGVSSLLCELGYLALQEESSEEAVALLAEALQTLLELGSRLHMITALEGFAWHAGQTGDPLRAARLWAAAATARETLNTPLTGESQTTFTRLIAEHRAAAPSPAAFEAAWSEGRILPLEDAARYVLSHFDPVS